MFWFNTQFLLLKEEHSKKFFIFNKVTELKEEINEDMFKVLKEVSNKHILDSILCDFLKQLNLLDILLEREILVPFMTTKMDVIFSPKKYSVNRIFLEISQKCNLRCSHCYNESSFTLDDSLSFSDIIKLVDKSKENGSYIFQITGGEPFIRKDISEIIDYIGKKGFKITIFTNLTYLPKSIIDLIKKYSVKIVTSIDFIHAEKHDAFRGKVGAFNLTIKNLKKLKNEMIDTRVNMMIDGKNDSELEEMINYLKMDLKVPYVADVIIPTGRGKDANRLQTLIHMSKRYKAIAIDAVLNNSELDLDEDFKCDKSCIYANDCGIGKSFIFIDSYGNATICPSMRKDESNNFYFGNIKKQEFEEILLKFTNKALKISCKYENKCKFSEQCSGGCRSRAYHFLGDTQEVDPIMCSIYHNENSEMMGWKNEIFD